MLAALTVFFICLHQTQARLSNVDLAKSYEQEIKEWHFHVYFFQNNPESNRSAESIFRKVEDLKLAGFFKSVPFRINYRPVGPHTIGSFQVWCPKEYFSRTYSWFLLNRGQHSVLIHPLTYDGDEIKDHTERAAWMGPSAWLDTGPRSGLAPRGRLGPVLQYPELGLGYNATGNQNCEI